jgi:mono/diheme cytochrome c family protein
MRRILFVLVAAFVLLTIVLLDGCSSGQTNSAPRSASADAKTLKNPNAVTPQSLATGKRLFERLCADCHGPTGNGVSEAAQSLGNAGDVKPSDLTDGKWDHGSTDGEIFVNIRDGVGANGVMRGLNGKPGISDREMWDIVNYVRSLPKSAS